MCIARSLVGIVAAASCVFTSGAWAQPASCPRILDGPGSAELQTPSAAIVWDRDGAGPEAPLLVIAAQAFSDSPTGAQNLIGWDGQKYVRMFTGSPPDVTFAQLFIHSGQLFGLSSANELVQFNSSSWTSVLPTFGVIKEATSFGGEIVVCGTQQGTNLKGVFALRGGAWVLLGSAFNNDVNSIAISNGQLVAAGSFTLPGITGVRAAYFDGAAWQPLGTSSSLGFNFPPNRIRAVGDKVLAGNGVVVAILSSGAWARSAEDGLICGTSETHIYAWEHTTSNGSDPEPIKVYDGQSWTKLDVASQEQIEPVSSVLEYQGRVFAFGTGKTSGSLSASRVNALELVDARWRPFGEGALSPVRSMAIAPDGTLITLCGVRSIFENSLYPAHPFSRAWNGSQFSPAGTAFPGPPDVNNPPRSVFYELTPDPEFGLLAGGYFFGNYQYTPLTAVVQYSSGAGWGGIGSRLFEYKSPQNNLSIPKVYKVIRYQGVLFALGEFSLTVANESSSFARYDDGTWVAVSPAMALPTASRLRNAIVFDNKLFVVGSSIGAFTFSYFDGSTWSAPTSALHQISPFCVHAGQLYAVGNSGLSVVRWNGSGWDPVGADLPSTTYALATCSGSLYAGGVFGVRKWNGSTWNTLPNVNFFGTVQALLEHNGELAIGTTGSASYVSGSVTNSSSGFARFTLDNIPVILQDPISRIGKCGETTTLTVMTANYGPTSYHWYKDNVLLANGPTGTGSVLSGVSAKSLVITNLSSSDGGSYHCVVSVSSLCGSNTSDPATVAATCCPADLNNDLVVDDADFALFSASYDALVCGSLAMPAGCQADLSNDGFVDDSDFLLFAIAYDDLACP